MANLSGVIVVCDDDFDTLEVVAAILQSAGHSVYTATRHAEVFRLVDVVKPDLLLCDIYLPGRNGFQIAEELRMQDSSVPILFMTAFDMGLYRAYAPNSAKTGCIAKPLDPATLLQRVEITLRVAAAQKRRALEATTAA